MTVVILEDAAEDLEVGAKFYESCAVGVGDYFLDSILSDLDSLVLFAGVHPIHFVTGTQPPVVPFWVTDIREDNDPPGVNLH